MELWPQRQTQMHIYGETDKHTDILNNLGLFIHTHIPRFDIWLPVHDNT